MSRIRESGLSPSPRDVAAGHPAVGMAVVDDLADQKVDDAMGRPGLAVAMVTQVGRDAPDNVRFE